MRHIARLIQRLAEAHVVLVCAGLAILIAIWVGVLHSLHAAQDQAQRSALQATERLAEAYEAQVLRALNELDLAFKLVDYGQSISGARAVDLLQKKDLLLPRLLFTIRLIDRRGRVLFSSHPRGWERPVSDAMLASHARGNEVWVGSPESIGESYEPRMELSRRIGGAGSGYTHIVTIDAPVEYLVSDYDVARFGREGVLAVIGTDGVFRVLRQGSQIVAGMHSPYELAAPQADASEVKVALVASPWDGVNRFTAARKLAGFPLALVVALPESEQLEVLQAERTDLLGWAFAASAVVVLLTLVLSAMSWRVSSLRQRANEALRDAQGLREHEEILRAAKEAAEAASQSKSRFLANMSHEIRTPMHGILGMLKLIERSNPSAQQLDYAHKAQAATQSLLRLIDDILDFSKIEADRLTLDPHAFSLSRLLADLAVILSATVGGKPIDVLFDVDRTVPDSLTGDALRLKQVLLNLLGNAVKFTSNGHVALRIRVNERHADRCVVAVVVEDTGIGIDPEHLTRIFEGFHQAEASTSRRFGGSGLGLTITQRLLALMGARLQVSSRPGQGSCFEFSLCLPLGLSDSPADEPAGAARELVSIGCSALAQDNLRAMASRLGWSCEALPSAQALIDRLSQAGGKSVDAVVVDGHVGASEWARLCQAWPELGGPRRPVLIRWGDVDTHTEASCVDRRLSKPCTAAMLRSAVCDAPQGRLADAASRMDSPARLSGLRLLVVEDTPLNQEVAKTLLAAEGAQVDLANDGLSGVRMALAARPPYDLILMDLQMPGMDGLAATREIIAQAGPGKPAPPIVAMTANAMASDRAQCLAAGMVDHVGKPFDLDQLVATLCQHTGRARGAVSTDAAPVPGAASLAFDAEQALRRLGGDRAFYARSLRQFAQSAEAALDDLAAQLQAQQWGEAARGAHTIKGLSGLIGAVAYAAQAAALERQCLAGAQAPASVASVDAVRLTCSALLDAMRASLGPVRGWIDAQLALAPDPGQSALRGERLGSVAGPQTSTPSEAQGAVQMAPGLLVELIELERLLADSDMGATAVCEELARREGASHPELLAIDALVGQLDFESALRRCTALRAQLRA